MVSALPDSPAPIEELAVPWDAVRIQDKVARRRRLVRSRLISLAISVVIMVVIYLWQREQLTGPGIWVIFGTVLGISLVVLAVAVLAYRFARAELAEAGPGYAVRIGRRGVQVADLAAPWSEVASLAAVAGRVLRGPRLRLTLTDGRSASVPFDQIDVWPATLDTTARAYSAGRFGVDLTGLDN